MPTRRLLLALLAAAATTACTSTPACAAGNLVDMQIVDRSRGCAIDPEAACAEEGRR